MYPNAFKLSYKLTVGTLKSTRDDSNVIKIGDKFLAPIYV